MATITATVAYGPEKAGLQVLLYASLDSGGQAPLPVSVQNSEKWALSNDGFALVASGKLDGNGKITFTWEDNEHLEARLQAIVETVGGWRLSDPLVYQSTAAPPPTLYETDADVSTNSASVYENVIPVELEANKIYLLEHLGTYRGAFGTLGPDLTWSLPAGAEQISSYHGTKNGATATSHAFSEDESDYSPRIFEDNLDNSAYDGVSIIETTDAGTATLTMASTNNGTTMYVDAGSGFLIREIDAANHNKLASNLTSTGTTDWKTLASITLEANKVYVIKSALKFTSTATVGSVPKFRLSGLPSGATAFHQVKRNTSGENNEEDFGLDEAEVGSSTSATAGDRPAANEIVIIVGSTGGTVELQFASMGATNTVINAGGRVCWYTVTTSSRLSVDVLSDDSATWVTTFSFVLSASQSYYGQILGAWQKDGSSVTGNLRFQDAPSTLYANTIDAQAHSSSHIHRTDNTATPNKFLPQAFAAVAGAQFRADGGAGGTMTFQHKPTTNLGIDFKAGSVAVLEEIDVVIVSP